MAKIRLLFTSGVDGVIEDQRVGFRLRRPGVGHGSPLFLFVWPEESAQCTREPSVG